MKQPASMKDDAALRTIGEVSSELGIPPHILRYWETRFTQLRPLTRSGNRRYYRPADIDLVRTIDNALGAKGLTIRGVQQMLDAPLTSVQAASQPASLLAALRSVSEKLTRALQPEADRVS